MAAKQPASPRDAATVLLVRDRRDGIEVFLQRRVTGMAFAGGMTVFPGGRVDETDFARDVPWFGPPSEWWASRFHCSPDLAAALVVAAVRETFEETGVLLAGGVAEVVDTTPFTAERRALVERTISLAEFLQRHELVLRADLLRPWAHWITPDDQPRRYDTRFFLAVLPRAQSADGLTSEAESTCWSRPADVLGEYEAGQVQLMLPTRVNLTELADCGEVETAWTMARQIAAIQPSSGEHE